MFDFRGSGRESGVKDFGIGIPEQDIPRLFEPFVRASNTGNVKGTGLGLAIVREAVNLTAGDIRVESTVGRGTTFIVQIPQ